MEYIERIIELNTQLDLLNFRKNLLISAYRSERGKTKLEVINDEFYNITFQFYKASLELLKAYEKIKPELQIDSKRNLEVAIEDIERKMNKIADGMERFDD